MKRCSFFKTLAPIFIQCVLFTTLFAQTTVAPSQPNNDSVKFPEANEYVNTNLTYNIIDAPNNTFCYDIYSSGRLMIHQTSKPGLPGNEGFKTKDDAVKVAELVMYKIRKGEMPPTVTEEEMKELGVIK